jgi:hypothetical protein
MECRPLSCRRFSFRLSGATVLPGIGRASNDADNGLCACGGTTSAMMAALAAIAAAKRAAYARPKENRSAPQPRADRRI